MGSVYIKDSIWDGQVGVLTHILSGDAKQAVGCTGPEFVSKIQAGDINYRVPSIQMSFKGLRQ